MIKTHANTNPTLSHGPPALKLFALGRIWEVKSTSKGMEKTKKKQNSFRIFNGYLISESGTN